MAHPRWGMWRNVMFSGNGALMKKTKARHTRVREDKSMFIPEVFSDTTSGYDCFGWLGISNDHKALCMHTVGCKAGSREEAQKFIDEYLTNKGK